jgi:hypothetical protein
MEKFLEMKCMEYDGSRSCDACSKLEALMKLDWHWCPDF